jgi:hypothetical protein
MQGTPHFINLPLTHFPVPMYLWLLPTIPAHDRFPSQSKKNLHN